MGICVLFKNASDKKVIDKQLTEIARYNIEFKGDANVLKPTIVLTYSPSILQANYCYLEELGRYYYIGTPVLVRQSAIIECNVDVLMSHKNAIKNCTCICERSASKYNMYLNDGYYKQYQYNTVVTRLFPQGFSKNLEFILMVGG